MTDYTFREVDGPLTVRRAGSGRVHRAAGPRKVYRTHDGEVVTGARILTGCGIRLNGTVFLEPDGTKLTCKDCRRIDR